MRRSLVGIRLCNVEGCSVQCNRAEKEPRNFRGRKQLLHHTNKNGLLR